ncbi:TolC family protein [Rhodocaloribacter sp.]
MMKERFFISATGAGVLRRAFGARRMLLALVLLLPAAGALHAQTPEAGPELRVYDAIETALANSPFLNRKRRQVEMRQGERWSAFGIHAPEITYFREGIPTGGNGGFTEQRWGFSQTIDFPLQSYYRVRRIDTEREARTLEVEDAVRSVRAAVKQAYTDLVYSLELVRLRREEVTLMEDLIRAVRTRMEVGEAAEIDLMKAEIEQAEAQNNLAEAEKVLHTARYVLFRVIGLDPDEQSYEIRFPDTLRFFPVEIDQASVLARLKAQPALLAADRDLEAARVRLKEEKSALLPRINFQYYPQDFGRGYRNYGFQVGLSLPLWLPFNHRGRMGTARAREQDQVWRRQGVLLRMKNEIEQAWHNYDTSLHTIRRYQQVVRLRSAELMQRTREGYRLGELDLLTLLDTQRTYLNSQKRYYDVLHEYYRNLIELERFTGEDIVYNPEYMSK